MLREILGVMIVVFQFPLELELMYEFFDQLGWYDLHDLVLLGIYEVVIAVLVMLGIELIRAGHKARKEKETMKWLK